MKLKTLCAALALALSAAACSDSSITGPEPIGPPPALPAGLDTVTTGTGLQYVDVAVGTGAVASNGSRVRVHYTGWLLNGVGFDTSRGGPPLEFVVGTDAILAGFVEGVIGMRVGGKRRLIVPPALGYGSQPVVDQRTGAVIIPANSTLVFDVELVSVS